MDANQHNITTMFNEIAPTYDRANRIMSLGMDRTWRRRACELVLAATGQAGPPIHIADVACGTGDMIEAWEKAARAQGSAVSLTGVDIAEQMTDIARGRHPSHTIFTAPAERLPLDDASQHVVSCAFGVRNIVARREALREFHRVLKPQGQLVILEFMRPRRGAVMGHLRDWYTAHMLPLIGGMISKKRAHYAYLPRSMRAFITADAFTRELQAAGFTLSTTRTFTLGVTTLFIAARQEAPQGRQ